MLGQLSLSMEVLAIMACSESASMVGETNFMLEIHSPYPPVELLA
jgi:hypothetical protein